jgi:DNA-binding CsgD family transcriptional regulator
VTDTEKLRPLERRILRLVDDGMTDEDIGERFGRSPDFVRRVVAMSELPGRTGPGPRSSGLRPLERRVLRWRDEGAAPSEIGPRFGRSPEFVERVEALANYKLSR